MCGCSGGTRPARIRSGSSRQFNCAFDSFANLADIIIAEPGAIVGLASMRAIKDSASDQTSTDVHTSESHLQHGMIDAVLVPAAVREPAGGEAAF